MTKTLLSILTAAAVTYLVRVLPLTLIRKPIRSRFLRSFSRTMPVEFASVIPTRVFIASSSFCPISR